MLYRTVPTEDSVLTPPDWLPAKRADVSRGFLAVLILCALAATGGVATAIVLSSIVQEPDACAECDFCH